MRNKTGMQRLTQRTLPGTDQACIQIVAMAITPKTWANSAVPELEYPRSSRPSWAKSVMFCGQEKEKGSDQKPRMTAAVERGKTMNTNNSGA